MPSPPSTGRVTSPYGPRSGADIGPGVGAFHFGEDTTGDGNYAPEAGTVVFAGYAGSFGNAILVRAGNVVWNIAHHKNLNGRHRGQRVAEGEFLAPQGATGLAFGVHVHTEHRTGGADSIQSGAHANPRTFYTSTGTPAGSEDDMSLEAEKQIAEIHAMLNSGTFKGASGKDEAKRIATNADTWLLIRKLRQYGAADPTRLLDAADGTVLDGKLDAILALLRSLDPDAISTAVQSAVTAALKDVPGVDATAVETAAKAGAQAALSGLTLKAQ